MTGKLQNIVVLAGSGNLGPGVIKELLAAGLTVTATTRKDSQSTFAQGVKVVPTDYSHQDLVSIFEGQDAVLSLAAGSHLTDQKGYIDAAVEAGVKRFFPSEFGGDTTDSTLTKALPLFGQKQQVVEHLKSKESSGLSWTGIVSGAFFDWGLAAGFFGLDLTKKTAKIYDNGVSPFTTTTIATIGKALVSILTRPGVFEATANKYVAIKTATISQNDILTVLQETSENQWSIDKVDSSAEIKAAEAEVAKGNYAAYYGILQAHLLGNPEGSAADVQKDKFGIWNDELGLPVEDYKEIIRKVAANK